MTSLGMLRLVCSFFTGIYDEKPFVILRPKDCMAWLLRFGLWAHNLSQAMPSGVDFNLLSEDYQCSCIGVNLNCYKTPLTQRLIW